MYTLFPYTTLFRSWVTDDFSEEINDKAKILKSFTNKIVKKYPSSDLEQRGRGLTQGIAINEPGVSTEVCAQAFEQGLILEKSGSNDDVIKFLLPLSIHEV